MQRSMRLSRLRRGRGRIWSRCQTIQTGQGRCTAYDRSMLHSQSSLSYECTASPGRTTNVLRTPSIGLTVLSIDLDLRQSTRSPASLYHHIRILEPHRSLSFFWTRGIIDVAHAVDTPGYAQHAQWTLRCARRARWCSSTTRYPRPSYCSLKEANPAADTTHPKHARGATVKPPPHTNNNSFACLHHQHQTLLLQSKPAPYFMYLTSPRM